METPNGPWAHAFVRTPTGHQIHYVHAGPVDGLPIVLVHGWPDLWFGWRNQIKALGSIYRVIVPDLRGFGQSSCPREVSAYGGKNITNDLVALLDAIKIDKAVFIGHDWGGHMVWRMCLYHPQRVLAVCSVCTPYIPPRDVYIDLDTVIKITPSFAYQKFLSDPANAASYLDTSPRRLFTMLYRRYYEVLPPEERIPFPDMLKGVKDSSLSIYTKPSTLLTSKEMEYYIQQYTKTGFQTGLNFYATHKIDYENELGLSRILTMPALYIGAQYDAVLKPDMAKKMPQFIPNLTMKIVKEAGHWILCEQPVQVNTHLLEWLESINSKVKGKQAKL